MKIYDITHTIENNMTAYCKEEKVQIKSLWSVENEGYNVTELMINTHSGTHIDMPKHLFQNGEDLEWFTEDKFIGKAFVLDCRKQKEISKSFIEKNIKDIKTYRYLLFKTGTEGLWGNEAYLKEYITFTKDAVDFLGNLDNLYGIGIDAISIDGVDCEELENHKGILGSGKIILENLCNLKDLEGEFEIIIAPLKIKAGDGAPARILLRK
ncbi:MAG: cyclase family protein [Clostridium sp.]|uniref:cyclase family protein n=1 Tax=Clostridium sp. TaxID=1506 RepID=UPI003F2A36B0